ncbi:VOC family protein [Labrys sp. KB_33_2]|uniref:VOC family protein n=1 Tax=Labrys sp. KB_33_2 TaxID=3237479 RepID=UPI003F93599C
MSTTYRDLRYLRVDVDDLCAATQFATEVFGLQPADRDETHARFRSDSRNYALCYTTAGDGHALGLTVNDPAALADIERRANDAGHGVRRFGEADCRLHQIKQGIAISSPNGVIIEIIWRPLTLGWRYHGPRDAGIVDFQAVTHACKDIAANEIFWTNVLGLRVTDWVGDAVFLALDEAHHRIALYPSRRDGLLGATWAVEDKNNVMQNWYFLQKQQMPIAAGPGRQPTSNAIFVTTVGPGGLLMSYAAEMDRGPHIAVRGPRQFADTARSHCAWGSPTEQVEFQGRAEP